MLYWQYLHRTTNETCIQTADLEACSFSNHVSTPILTLSQSKLFCVRFPTLQSPETEVYLATRAKKTISSMLVLIPVSKKNEWRELFCPFFAVLSEHRWSTVNINRLFFHASPSLKSDRIRNVVYTPELFSSLLMCQISC
jgi:hypothetical protein